MLSFARDDSYRLCYRNFLQYGFENFADLDYCVLLVPTDQKLTNDRYSFVTRDFTRIPIKADRDFPMTLYVSHRALIGDRDDENFNVRKARSIDYPDVVGLLQGVKGAASVMHDFGETFKQDDDCSSYLFFYEKVIVGLAIVW